MIVGISMCKDEQDIIGSILAHLLDEGVDHILVADNMSTDHTRAILDSFGEEFVTVVEDTEVGYYQDRKMTNLAHYAGVMGADWVLPFDADELWYSRNGSLGSVVSEVRGDVIVADTYQHVPHPDDSDDLDPILRMQHRVAEPKRLSKVMFRYHPDARLHMGNHDVDHPGSGPIPGLVEIREFQYRTFEQFCRKLRNGAAAYAATDLNEMYGTHWRRAAHMTDDELRAEWDALCATDGLLHDPAPVNRSMLGFAA